MLIQLNNNKSHYEVSCYVHTKNKANIHNKIKFLVSLSYIVAFSKWFRESIIIFAVKTNLRC